MNDMAVPTVQGIFAATSRSMGVPLEVMRDGHIRTREVTYARGLAFYLARKLTFKSYRQLADESELFTTHTAVVKAIERIESQASLADVKRDLAEITQAMK